MNHFYEKHTVDGYYQSHKPRFDFLTEKFGDLLNERILDIGSGPGYLLRELNLFNDKHGIDGTEKAFKGINHIQHDLNYPFAHLYDKPFTKIFCLETIEHIPNVFNVLNEIRKLSTPKTDIYLSIPEKTTLHPVFYYHLFFPVENFKDLLEDMAFEIISHETHRVCHSQEFFHLRILEWKETKMKHRKPELDGKNIALDQYLNL